MQQYNVIAMTTVRQRQQQEQLRNTTIQTTIKHVAHLPVVDIDDATAAAAANCVHLNSGPATFLIPGGGRGGGGGGDATKLPPLRWPLQIPHWFLGAWPQKKNHCVDWSTIRRVVEDRRQKKTKQPYPGGEAAQSHCTQPSAAATTIGATATTTATTKCLPSPPPPPPPMISWWIAWNSCWTLRATPLVVISPYAQQLMFVVGTVASAAAVDKGKNAFWDRLVLYWSTRESYRIMF